MKDQILKIAGVKSEKEFYKKYPSEEAFMKAHGKAFKKAAMGSKMVNDQLHQLTDFGNPPIAQYGIGMKKKPQNFNNYLQGTNQAGMNPDGSIKQVGDAFNNATMAKMSGQQMGSDMSAQFATPSADKLLGKNDINSGAKAGGFDAGAAGMAAVQGIGKIIGGIEAIGAQKKARKKAQQSAELSGLSLQAQQTMKPPKNQYVRPEDSLVQPGQLGDPYGTGTNYLQAQNGIKEKLYNYGKTNYPKLIEKLEEIGKRGDVMFERGSLNPELPMHSDTLYPGNKYKDAFMKTPNIRTKNDNSFKKGHPLTNEQKAIVLHHTGYTDTARDNDVSWAMRGVDKLFRTPGEASSHVVIDFNGNRYNYANPNQVAYHAGNSMMNGRDNVNDFGVGVEFQGDTDKRPLTKEQLESFMEYAAPIMKKNKIPIDNVVTHKQIRKNYIDKNPNDKKAAAESKPDVSDKEYSKIIQALKKKGAFQMGGALSGATGMIGGNPTEIQNTYTPGDLYSDLGYEPMEETLKQYRHGGDVPKAEFGEYFQDSGQAQIGSAVGGAVAQGFGLPPVVGEVAGKLLGNVFGGAKNARELQAQNNKAALNQSQMGFIQNRSQGPLNVNTRNGGWISHDWQPQTFTKFGEYSAKDLLKPPHDADMLRAGGSIGDDYYTPPSARALQTYEYGGQMALGGELQIGEGGYAETLSYNPNLPGGEIGMFRGASHDNGGIQTQYGENGVEVEGGEPFTILEDNGSEDGNNLEGGGSKENLVVFGNIKINKEIADLMGDPKAKGKKFKTYIADVAKNDAKQLKTIQKGLELIEEYDGNSSYDRLGMNSGMASLMGAKAQQKINADKIKEAGIVQDSIHKVANEYGVKSDKLAEGKFEKETDPSMVAQKGVELPNGPLDGVIRKSYNATPPLFARMLGAKAISEDPNNYNAQLLQQFLGQSLYKGPSQAATVTPFTRKNTMTQAFKDSNKSTTPPAKPAASSSSKGKGKGKAKSQVYVPPTAVNLTDSRQDNYTWNTPQDLPNVSASSLPNISSSDLSGAVDVAGVGSEGRGGKFGDILKKYGPTLLSNLAPFLRPSNANDDLPPDQLYPEYYAMATNQLEPVQAQKFQPMLDTPYDISLNDQINAIDSQARAAIRAGGNNPAAQSIIMSQAIEAKNKVLGEQTRINQANKMGVYDKNRAVLNDAQLKNLGILDQQYVRQSQAKSNTKAQTQAALSSIAAKTAQQRASNRKLAIMENMYGFRFSPSGRAINMNAPAQFNMSGNPFGRAGNQQGLSPGYGFTYDDQQQIIGTRRIPKSSQPSMDDLDDLGKNGKKIKARNSSIVKALKNL